MTGESKVRLKTYLIEKCDRECNETDITIYPCLSTKPANIYDVNISFGGLY